MTSFQLESAAENIASDILDEAIDKVKDSLHSYELLHDKIIAIITRDPKLKVLVHSYKSRFKDLNHLRRKIERKNLEDNEKPISERKGCITRENIQNRITDICGIRILHLYQGQFKDIHEGIMKYVTDGELFLFEPPKAYTWDPEYSEFFTSLNLASELRSSLYTSVHYVIKPREDSDVTCEIQVRTLFEEVWGEIDHHFNYPIESDNFAVKEQLKILARLVGAGTRLADSIFKISSQANN